TLPELLKIMLKQPAFTIGPFFTATFFHLVVVLGGITAGIFACYLLKISLSVKVKTLLFATWVSILAPFSWFLLAQNHTSIHTVQCSVLWYLPFAILLYFLFAYLINTGLHLGIHKILLR
ncbi:MAG: hypothetical protein ACK5L3_01115, partial [Oscillospiraceae bacterium]